jgi:hypothetical protein
MTLIMQGTETTSDEMVQIPAQAWYGLVVYDLTLEEINNFFGCADPAVVDSEAMVELCESGLSYISDRFVDGSHDRLDNSNKPHTERLKRVADELEEWRKEWLITASDFDINAEAIEDYLDQDYINRD